MLQHFCTPGTARPSHPAPGCRARSYSDWLLNISTSFCQPCWTLLKIPHCRYCIGLETFNTPRVLSTFSVILATETFNRKWDVGGWSQSCVTSCHVSRGQSEGSEDAHSATQTLSLASAQRRERGVRRQGLLSSFPDLGSNNNCLKNEIVDLIDTRIIDILT